MPDRYTPEQRRSYMRYYYSRRLTEALKILGNACIKCGSQQELRFDYVHPEARAKPITSMILGARVRLLAELRKYQLLCSDCYSDKDYDKG